MRAMLEQSEGVTLEEITLENGGTVVDRAYLVTTLRSPQTWNFSNINEARSRFNEEVTTCKTDALVQKRLAR